MRKYNAESPKQGSRRFNYIVKTKYIDNLGIVNLCFAHCKTLKYVQGVDDKSTVFTTVVAGQAALSPSRPGN